MKVTKRLWSIAYHEAGHAAVAFELRVAIKKVTIEPEGDSLGYVLHQKRLSETIEWDNLNRYRWRMEKRVMVALAGYHAEKKFNPKGVRHYSFAQDRRNSMEVVNCFCGGIAEMEAYLKWLDVRTQGHLSMSWVWLGVERLAEALIEHGTLKGRRVRQILQDARQEDLDDTLKEGRKKTIST